MAFTPAVKEAFTLKLAIVGIAGVGKSFTSFQLAKELADGQRFAVIDSENRKARKYADEFQFDVNDLNVFSLAEYTKALHEAENAGYKVLVIDGLSQLWEGRGGIKEMVDTIAKRDRIAHFNAWGPGNALLFDFVKLIIESPLHIICTMRSKVDYSSEFNKDGKMQYRRVGLAPIQKDNLEFEFDLFTEMDHEHHMIFQKSLCRKLSGKVLAMSQEGEAKRLVAMLKKWMEGAPPARAAASQSAQPEQTEPSSLEAKKAIAIKWAERLKINKPLVEEMSEAALDDKIQQYKQEYQQRQQSAKAEAEARSALITEK